MNESEYFCVPALGGLVRDEDARDSGGDALRDAAARASGQRHGAPPPGRGARDFIPPQ